MDMPENRYLVEGIGLLPLILVTNFQKTKTCEIMSLRFKPAVEVTSRTKINYFPNTSLTTLLKLKVFSRKFMTDIIFQNEFEILSVISFP